MDSFLVVGLESSCTRHVSIMIAYNLGIISEEWNGHDKVENESFSVVHRSLPHGSRDSYISKEYWMSFGTVVLCTRDFNCSLESKITNHQQNRECAIKEQHRGMSVMSDILKSHPRTEIFSYESAFLLGDCYNELFFKKIGVPYRVHIETKEINSKYLAKNA